MSLATQDSRIAATRARSVWQRTEEVFKAVLNGSLEADRAKLLLRHMAASFPWEGGPLDDVARRAASGDESEVLNVLQHGRDAILSMERDEQARVLLHLRTWLGMLEHCDRAPASVGHDGVDALSQGVGLARIARREREHLSLVKGLERQAQTQEPEAIQPPLSHYVESYLEEKQRTTRDSKGISGNSAYQARLTFRLWEEAMGPIPVVQVGRGKASDFRKLLLRLPTSHGKSSARKTVMEAITAADEKAKKEGSPVERMAMKTAKRHCSAMQQVWKWLLQEGVVDANPFAGLPFPISELDSSLRDDWQEADLLALLRSPYMQQAARERARDWWLIAICMWSGMRVEEICRLRPMEDVEVDQGTPMLLIEAQGAPLPEWSPKSQAGARGVPVHPMLQEAGLLDLARERRREERLVPGLVYSPKVEKYSAQASRQMSHVKQRTGVSDKTTAFHSFRHAVTTVLRDQPADELRTEWIDGVLGHKPGKGANTGAKSYYKRIGVPNLGSVDKACMGFSDVMGCGSKLIVLREISGDPRSFDRRAMGVLRALCHRDRPLARPPAPQPPTHTGRGVLDCPHRRTMA